MPVGVFEKSLIALIMEDQMPRSFLCQFGLIRQNRRYQSIKQEWLFPEFQKVFRNLILRWH
ncbi:hypothetical protein D3C81_1103240 [compost metagenome]